MKASKKILSLVALTVALTLNVYAQRYDARVEVAPNGITAPAAEFHSTSNMLGSGSSYASNPRLDNDGTAPYCDIHGNSASGPGHGIINRSKEDNTDPGITDDNSSPIGDGVWAMLFCALAFAGVIALRRRVVKE